MDRLYLRFPNGGLGLGLLLLRLIVATWFFETGVPIVGASPVEAFPGSATDERRDPAKYRGCGDLYYYAGRGGVLHYSAPARERTVPVVSGVVDCGTVRFIGVVGSRWVFVGCETSEPLG